MGIVKNGLIAYWNARQGVSGDKWSNIAPNTLGKYDFLLTGAYLKSDGIYFDGLDDIAETIGNPYTVSNEITVEVTGVVHAWGKFSPTRAISFIGASSSKFYSLLTWIDYSPIIPGLNPGFFFTTGENSGLPNIVPYNLPLNTLLFIQATIDTRLGIAKLFINGALIGSIETVSGQGTYNLLMGNTEGLTSEATIYSAKIYNRILTDAELTQNYQNGSEVGLTDAPASTPPTVTIVSSSKSRISDEPTMDITVLKFKFDIAVTQWEVRVMGSGQGTGTLADSGGAINANTEISAEIDWTELYQEGQNRVNVYGKGVDGLWTSYEN